MKKLWLLLSVFALGFTLTACNEDEDVKDDKNEQVTPEEDKVEMPTDADYELFVTEAQRAFKASYSSALDYEGDFTLEDLIDFYLDFHSNADYAKEDAYIWYIITNYVIVDLAKEMTTTLKSVGITKEQLDVVIENADVIALLATTMQGEITTFSKMLVEAKLTSEQVILTTYNTLLTAEATFLASMDKSEYKNNPEYSRYHAELKGMYEEAFDIEFFVAISEITEEQLDSYLELGTLTFDPVANYLYGLDSVLEVLENAMESGTLTESQFVAIMKQNLLSFETAFEDMTNANIIKALDISYEIYCLLNGEVADPNMDNTEEAALVEATIKTARITFEFMAEDDNAKMAYKLYNDFMTLDSLEDPTEADYEKMNAFSLNLYILSSNLVLDLLNDADVNNLFDQMGVDTVAYKTAATGVSQFDYVDAIPESELDDPKYNVLSDFEDITIEIIDMFASLFDY